MPCLWPGEHASQAQPKYGKAFCRMRNLFSDVNAPSINKTSDQQREGGDGGAGRLPLG